MTIKQDKAITILAEKGGSIGAAMREAGYSEISSLTPKKLTNSKTWKQLMEEHLPDDSLAKVHRSLLNAHRLDHMTFPLGPAEEEESDILEEEENEEGIEGAGADRTTMTDGEIGELLASVNCTVRKVVHGRAARHVYFWSPDNKAKDSALDLAYKLKGMYAAEKVDHSLKISLDDVQRARLNGLLETGEEPVLPPIQTTVTVIEPKQAESEPVTPAPVHNEPTVVTPEVKTPINTAELDKLLA